MSFTEPLTVTTSVGATTLPRVSDDKADGVYRSADGRAEITADHQEGKRTRHVLRLNTSKIAPDQFRDDENVELSMSVYVVFDMPDSGIGYTNAEALANWQGLAALASASSNAVIVKLLGGES